MICWQILGETSCIKFKTNSYTSFEPVTDDDIRQALRKFCIATKAVFDPVDIQHLAFIGVSDETDVNVYETLPVTQFWPIDPERFDDQDYLKIRKPNRQMDIRPAIDSMNGGEK